MYSATENREVNYFDESDTELLKHIENYIPFGSNILSDHIIYRYYTPTENSYNIPYYTIHNQLYSLFSGSGANKKSKYTVFRKHVYDSGELEVALHPFGNPSIYPTSEIDSRTLSYTFEKAKTYDSRQNLIYYSG